ncbi:NAD(P)-dependent oxidoreductase [Candidatus Pelagibacter sp.]|nr:NAD(P)-dependent oxidoreductase [Candidatus Pelagibacter sp.]
MQKKILIFGSSGFIGKNLISILNKKKFKIYGTFNKQKPIFFDKIKYFKLNTLNKKNFKKLPNDIDTVIHLSNKVLTSSMQKKGDKIKISDHKKSLNNILNYCNYNGVKKIIYISSSTGYSDKIKNLKEEDYFKHKPSKKSFLIGHISRLIEKNFKKYSEELLDETKIIILRPTAIFGRYDNFNLSSARTLPYLIKKIDKSKSFIKLPGSGQLVRNWIFASDFCVLISKIILLDFKKKLSVFNVASHEYISTYNLAKKICGILNKKNFKILTESKTVENQNLRKLNTHKLKKVGLKLKTKALVFCLKETINWYKKNK